MCSGISWTHFDDPSALAYCRLEFTAHHITTREIGTNRWGKGIELLSQPELSKSFVGSPGDLKPKRVPLMGRSVVGIQLDSAFEFPFGVLPLPRFARDQAERSMRLRERII